MLIHVVSSSLSKNCLDGIVLEHWIISLIIINVITLSVAFSNKKMPYSIIIKVSLLTYPFQLDNFVPKG